MRIKAATLAIFPANLHTQALMHFKNNTVKSVRDWDKTYPLRQACLTELQWWMTNLSQWNGRSLLPQTPEHCVFVDASEKGWGGVFQNQTVQGSWTNEERSQSINWRELKAIELTLLAFPSLRDTLVLNTNTQHHNQGIHQSPRRYPLPVPESACNKDMGQLSPTNFADYSATHTRHREHTGEPGVSPVLPEKSLETNFVEVCSTPGTVGTTRRGSICRSHDQSFALLCELEVGSSGNGDRRSCNSVDSISQLIYESAMESDNDNSTKDQSRTSMADHTGSPTLADCHLVPLADSDGDRTAHLPEPENADNAEHPFRSLSLDKSELETLRLETIRSRFEGQGYSQIATHTLMDVIFHQTGVN